MYLYLLAGAAWGAAAAIGALWLCGGIRIADRMEPADRPCCGTGHPESGPDDDVMDVGTAILEPRTSTLLVSRPPVPAPATRPLRAVRPGGA